MDRKCSFEQLYRAVLRLETVDECRRFFEDICTMGEMIAIAQRLKVAEMLDEGKNYAQISSATGASTATIGRVNRCYMYGNGGYRDILYKLRREGMDDGCECMDD